MRTHLIALLLGIGLLGLAPTSQASLFGKRTTLIFNGPVEIPGMVLQPGKYVVERTVPMTDPDILTFWNDNQTRVYATVMALPVYRKTPAKDVTVTFAERPGYAPMALKTLFYPGDRMGHEFVYRTTTVARLGNLSTPTVSGTILDPLGGAVCRNDGSQRLQFDLCIRQLLDVFEKPVTGVE